MSANGFAAQVGAGGQAAGRPAVRSLSIKEKAALYAAFMPFVRNGEVYLILTLLDDPTKIPVAGRVVWVSPSGGGASKTPGIGVQFPADDSGFGARKRIEDALGAALRSARPTHTL